MAKFSTGRLYMTKGVYSLASESASFNDFVARSFIRHIKGDWGDLGSSDKRSNDLSLSTEPAKQGRLHSRYNNPEGNIYIITEWDRSYTIILFPEEY